MHSRKNRYYLSLQVRRPGRGSRAGRVDWMAPESESRLTTVERRKFGILKVNCWIVLHEERMRRWQSHREEERDYDVQREVLQKESR